MVSQHCVNATDALSPDQVTLPVQPSPVGVLPDITSNQMTPKELPPVAIVTVTVNILYARTTSSSLAPIPTS